MRVLLYLLPLVPLCIMVASDFKKRKVSVLWLALFGVLQFATAFAFEGSNRGVTNLIHNLCTLAMLYSLLWVYIKILRSKKFASFEQGIGLGDILFLPLLSPAFDKYTFLVFLLAAFIFSLAWWAILYFTRYRHSSVPLISTVGCSFILYQFYSVLT